MLRDPAIVLTLRHSGLRVAEPVGQRLGDVELDERSDQVRVHQGEGGRYRTVALNLEVRAPTRSCPRRA